MFAFNDILQKIEQEITRLQFTYPPKSLYDPIEYILSLGGKRIRPALVLMACNLYKENVDTAVNPALGLEVFHNFTLLHDDLMDDADKRRNKPTVHKVWNANTAILSGDAMLIAAYQLIGETESESLKEILDLFTRTALEICGGQQYDMEFESRTDVTEEEYIEMIRLKTAVLLACALKMGAIMGNAPKADAETLYQFGINIGYNAGFDIAYSGTVAAAMEAVMNGIPAIAFSAQHDGSYDVTDRYILDIARELLAAPLAPGEIWNVNFPGCPLDEFKGILHERTIAPKFIFDNTYSANHRSGGMTLIPDADFIAHGDAPAGSDIEAVLHGYISIGKVKSMVL